MPYQSRTQPLYRFLIEKLKLLAEYLRIWLQNRWVRYLLQSLILSFTILYLYRNFRSVDLSQMELNLNFIQLGWSLVITTGALFLGASGWWFTLMSLGQHTEFIEAVNIHLVSNLAKYIPGYAWQLLSKGYLTHKTGAPTKVVGVSMTLELGQIFLTGIWLIIFFFPVELVDSIALIHDLGERFVYIRVGLLGVSAISLLVLLYIVKRMDIVKTSQRFESKYLAFALLSILIGWLLFGLAFWMIGNAIQPISSEYIPSFVFTLAMSFLIGLMIFIIPASIGIRESVMVFFLGNILPAPIAVLVATLSRIILTICELFSAGGIYLYHRLRQNKGEFSANFPK